jgi:methionyl-tRNA formyltransferase
VRVFLLVFPASLFMPTVVEHVAIAGQFELVGVGGIEPQSRGSRRTWLRAQVGYWGVSGTAWIAAATMFRKLPALLRFPRVFRRLSSLAEVCNALEIPYAAVPDVNDPAFIAKLRDLEVDVVVSFQQQIFKRALLQTPKIACLNVHTGLLPGYRGFKPVFWMQSRQEPELGVTIHTMSERIDTGRIVVQRRWKRRADSSVLENQLWSYRCAAHCIVESVEKIGECPPQRLDNSPDTSPYFKAPTKAERNLAIARGTRLL